jgi:hypothetical protein
MHRAAEDDDVSGNLPACLACARPPFARGEADGGRGRAMAGRECGLAVHLAAFVKTEKSQAPNSKTQTNSNAKKEKFKTI